MPAAAAVRAAFAVTIAAVAAACGGGSSAPSPSCPQDLPASCPATAPSWANDVQPILARRCWGCHADGGIEASAHDLSTWDRVHAQRTDVLDQVYGCHMPPSGAATLDPGERATLLAWLVCHAPDN